MAHAGEGYRVHFTGLTHDDRGYPDMSPEVHHQLVKRLIEKINRSRSEIIKTEYHRMEDAKIAVISFGSTARSARRAVREARRTGIPAGFMRLVSIWPFPEQEIRQLSQQVDAFIVAEMNLGQITVEIERYVSQPVIGVHHAGGAMMLPERIQEAILEVAGRGNGQDR
jgi:2-oxoglutarate ferredoxin oxidoreductase subunit alpha